MADDRDKQWEKARSGFSHAGSPARALLMPPLTIQDQALSYLISGLDSFSGAAWMDLGYIRHEIGKIRDLEKKLNEILHLCKELAD